MPKSIPIAVGIRIAGHWQSLEANLLSRGILGALLLGKGAFAIRRMPTAKFTSFCWAAKRPVRSRHFAHMRKLSKHNLASVVRVRDGTIRRAKINTNRRGHSY